MIASFALSQSLETKDKIVVYEIELFNLPSVVVLLVRRRCRERFALLPRLVPLPRPAARILVVAYVSSSTFRCRPLSSLLCRSFLCSISPSMSDRHSSVRPSVHPFSSADEHDRFFRRAPAPIPPFLVYSTRCRITNELTNLCKSKSLQKSRDNVRTVTSMIFLCYLLGFVYSLWNRFIISRRLNVLKVKTETGNNILK